MKIEYNLNQKEHHKKITFEQEVKLMLTHYQKTIGKLADRLESS